MARVGGGDASGFTVTIAGTATSATTAGDGSFVLPDPPDGIYALDVDGGDYHETVPSVLAIPSASGFYVDGSLFPLGGSTLVLPRGRRQQAGTIREARPSPRGDFVLFRSDDPPAAGSTEISGTLYTVAAAGGTPVAIAAAVNQPIVLSPDGTRVAYGVGSGESVDLWTAGVDGSGAVKVATAVSRFSFLPGGRYLTTQQASSPNWLIVPAGGGAPVPLSQTYIYSMVPSPQGDAVLVLDNCANAPSGPCDLRLVPAGGATPTVIAASVSWIGVGAAFDRVVYGAGGTIFVRDLAATTSTTLASGAGCCAQLTPDESQVVLDLVPAGGTTANVLSIIPATGGSATTLATGAGAFLLSPGGHVAYLEATQTNDLRTVALPAGPVQELAAKPSLYPAFALSPTGRYVVMRSFTASTISGAISLSIAPAETGVFHTVADNVLYDEYGNHAAYLFSPDDSRIAYVVDDGTFSSQGWLEVQPTAGGAPTQLAGAARWVISFSPGGTQLLYGVGQTPTAWTVPAGGGMPSALLDGVATDNYGVALNPFFVDDATVFAVRTASPQPFTFQNGLYRLRGN